MTKTISNTSVNTFNTSNELVELIQSAIRFFKVTEDGSISLVQKSREEIQRILNKGQGV